MKQIEGKVAIVTGGGGGVGEGIATRFGREGAHVVVVDSDGAAAEKVAGAIRAAGGNATAVAGDVAQDGVAAKIADDAAKAQGGIDILVNAQFPVTGWTRLEDKDAADFVTTMTGTVVAAARAMKAVFPHMKARGAGRIVNVGSMYGPTANEAVTDAIAADGALANLSRAAGVEWARYDILVNYLQAAMPDIPAFQKYHKEKGGIIDHLIANTPMKRLADPVEDIGGAAMFLVSDEACFIVGHKVYADGGQHLTAAVFEPGASR